MEKYYVVRNQRGRYFHPKLFWLKNIERSLIFMDFDLAEETAIEYQAEVLEVEVDSDLNVIKIKEG